MRIVVNCGHTKTGAGSGAVGFINESNETRNVGYALMDLLRKAGHEVIDATVNSASSSSAYLKKAVEIANAQSADLFISIHLNAGGGRGTEAYTYKGKQVSQAVKVCAKIAELGFKNRGVKDGSNLYVIKHTKATAILIECCFVDTDDATRYQNLGAQKMAEAICAGLIGSVPATSTPTPPPQNTGGNKYSVGQKVRFSTCYKSSTAPNNEAIPANKMLRDNGTITKIASGAKNPYLLDNGLCWVNDGDIREVLSGGSSVAPTNSYYSAFNSSSIVDGLKSIGVDSSFNNRKKIAQANGISNYSGTASQNEQLCNLARQGKLIKP